MVIPDSVHYLFGMLIVAFFVWVIIRLHKHFSKNIVPITSQTMTEQFLSRQAILPGPK